MKNDAKVMFVHHSTGNCVWNGGVPQWFDEYNAANGTQYEVSEQYFPKKEPYGWKNYPYDYWNIWVENAGDAPAFEEPTLEMLTKQYDVVVFKHCYPVSNILEDGTPDIASEQKTLANYKLQYAALKEKMRQFPDTLFIVWTGAMLVQQNTNEENAKRAALFFDWVKNEWDEPGDNIFVWDFAALQTEGGLYFRDEYAGSPTNSHPNEEFSKRVAPLFAQRVVDVIEGRGDA